MRSFMTTPSTSRLHRATYIPVYCINSPSSSNNQNVSSFLSSPAVAQRETLRQFYLSSSASEQLAVVKSSVSYLDTNTSLHLLCHTADLALKGQLSGDNDEQDELLRALYSTLKNQLPVLSVPQLGAMLWSFATVSSHLPEQDEQESPHVPVWMLDLVKQVAARERGGRVKTYNTKEVANLLFAIGRLHYKEIKADDNDDIFSFSQELVAELSTRMESAPYIKGSFSPSDFCDIATACASIYSSTSLSSSAVSLLELVASEVRRRMANRHPSQSGFAPRELTSFLRSYAALGSRNPIILESTVISTMLDALGGFVVGRITSRHLNALAKPTDVAALLESYSSLKHRSVVIPELLTAIGEQLRLNAATMQAVCDAKRANPTLQGFEWTSAPPDVECRLATLVSILESHIQLGYRPDDVTLHALLPGLLRELAQTASDASNTDVENDIVRLLELFVRIQYAPGRSTVQLFVARVIEGVDNDAENEGIGSKLTARARAAAEVL